MAKTRLSRLLRNNRAISSAVSNIILIVAAVLLSSVVVTFAATITTLKVQSEKLYIASENIWYVNSTTSIAAVEISNTGPTASVLTKIEVNGLQCQWNGTDSFVNYCEINGTFSGDLPFVDQSNNNGNSTINIGGQLYTFTSATEGLTIAPGYSAAFYVVVPNAILVYDLATPVNIVITSSQAIYCTQTLVQSV